MKKYLDLKRIILASAITLITILLFTFNVFSSLENKLIDLIYQSEKAINTDIIIIAIDEKSLNDLGKYDEWDRNYYAQVITNLTNNENNMPAVIGLDVIFNGTSTTAADDALVNACKGKTNIVMGSKFKFKDEIVNESVESIASLTKPYEALANCVTTGFTNAISDSDNYVRRTILHISKNNIEEDSFAYAIYKKYAAYNGEDILEKTVNKEYSFDFYSEPKDSDYTIISFSDVYNGQVPSFLTGSIVLIGAYDSGFQDDYFVPVSKGTKMNGVEIHANIIESLNHDTFYTDVNQIIIYITYIIFMFALIFFLYKESLKVCTIVIYSFIISIVTFEYILRQVGYVYPITYLVLILLIFYFYQLVMDYFIEKRGRMKIVKAFKQYVPHEIVEQMSKDESFNNTLGGVKKNIACLFVDIRGFTKLSEELSPEEIIVILNQYLGMVTEQVFKNGGMLDKYVGDAVMAVFNAPYDLEDFAFKACKTALDIINEGKPIQESVKKSIGKDLKYGVGVHIGDAIIGNIGCEFRMDFTAIGDTVNTAARLEANAKGDQILISDTLYEIVKDRFEFEYVGPMQFKNKANPIICYDIKKIK